MTRRELDAIRAYVEREQTRLRGKPVVADFGAVSFVDFSANLLAEIDRLKAKLEIATEALKYAAENNDHPEVMAEDALERMSKLDGE